MGRGTPVAHLSLPSPISLSCVILGTSLAKDDCGVARACAGVVATSCFADFAFGESQPRSLLKRVCVCMRIRVHASTRAHIRVGVRSLVRGRARALPGSIRNPYGFRFKPIRVSFQTRTGFKQTLYGFSKCGVWNVERGVIARQRDKDTRYFGITEYRYIDTS